MQQEMPSMKEARAQMPGVGGSGVRCRFRAGRVYLQGIEREREKGHIHAGAPLQSAGRESEIHVIAPEEKGLG